MSSLKGGFWTTNTNFEPKASFRFRVEIDGLAYEDAPGTTGRSNQGDYANDRKSDTPIAWYAKSVDKPGIEILSNVPEGDYFNLGDQSTRIDINLQQPKMKKITMKLVDPTYPNVTRKLLRWIRRTGYNDFEVTKALAGLNRDAQTALIKTIGHIRIHQLNAGPEVALFDSNGIAILDNQGNPVNNPLILETWTLYNAYPSRIDFGTLEYSNENLVEISIDWVYSNFTCDMIKLPPDTSDVEQAFRYFRDFQAFGGLDIAKQPDTSPSDCKKRWEEADSGQSLEEWKSTRPQDDKCYEPLPSQIEEELNTATELQTEVQQTEEGVNLDPASTNTEGPLFGPEPPPE